MSLSPDSSLTGWESVEESLAQLRDAGAALEQFLYEQLDQLGDLTAQLADAARSPLGAPHGRESSGAPGQHGSMQDRLDAAEAQIARWADAEQGSPSGQSSKPRSGDQLSQMVQLTDLLEATRRELAELKSHHDHQLARHDNQFAEQHSAWVREMQQLREALVHNPTQAPRVAAASSEEHGSDGATSEALSTRRRARKRVRH